MPVRAVATPPARLRVLALVDTLRPGGAERFAATVAARLDRRRFKPYMCVSRGAEDSPLVGDVLPDDVPLLDLGRRTRADVWKWARLLTFLRRERIDVLHAHMFGSNVWGTIVGRTAAVPVVIAHEHSWSFETRVRYIIDREVIARGADLLVAVSNEDRRRMIELERIPPHKVRVIPNGVPDLPPPRSDLRSELGIPARAPVIGTLTVLRPEKALDVLVEATAELAPELPGLKVIVAGAGPDDERLRSLIRRRELTQTVLLIGFRRNVADVLAALDVAVFSSDREGAPLALLEAMAAGRPIVATHVGGIPEVIHDGVHGLLVPRRDPHALATAIATVLRDRELAELLGRNARARQRRDFAVDTTVRVIEATYEELVAAALRRQHGAATR